MCYCNVFSGFYQEIFYLQYTTSLCLEVVPHHMCTQCWKMVCTCGVTWWEMACTCGVVGDGVHKWCGGRWCSHVHVVHVVWWEMVYTCTCGACGVVGDGVHMWCGRRSGP